MSMNKFFLVPLFLLAVMTSCRNSDLSQMIVSMQILDRNGFSETISNKDRLGVYQKVDFLAAQPYEKVLRVYGKDGEGKSHSKITSYHETGGAWQYLEAVDGRANGKYLEWHENGKVKIEGRIIEGLADFSPTAQKSWLFDGTCTVWDFMGNLEAEFLYDKGQLVGEAKFYFPSSQLQRIIPYQRGLIHGTLQEFDEEGRIVKAISFLNGEKEGKALSKWSPDLFQYQENYQKGRLISGSYYDRTGELIAEVEHGYGMRALFQEGHLHSFTNFQDGVPEGEVQIFNQEGYLQTTYHVKKGQKTGEEWEYYPSEGHEKRPKLLVNWYQDEIQGMVKTWYENGLLESQREMSGNKKHGLSFAYYRNGDLMMMEEYENDKLVKGSYFKKGEKHPISEISQGDGTATLYNADGHFMKKVTYERGKPVVD